MVQEDPKRRTNLRMTAAAAFVFRHRVNALRASLARPYSPRSRFDRHDGVAHRLRDPKGLPLGARHARNFFSLNAELIRINPTIKLKRR